MDYNGLFYNMIDSVLDSMALSVIKAQLEIRANYGKDPYKNYENGNITTYTLSCLEFYRSRKLDSFVKSISHDKYILNLDK